MPAALSHMDELEQIDFTEALSRLQGLIGTEVKATVNCYDHFFGCGLQGELNRIETLPPDHQAISVVLDHRTGFYLDPADTRSFLAINGDGTESIEFRLRDCISVILEPAT